VTDAIYDYEGLKVLAKDLGRPVETLVAQPPQSDPFYASRPGRRADAEWFAALWERFNFQRGVQQMDRYKQHQGKPITHSATTARRRRKANGGGAS
jgi:hypothetical protein